MRDAMNSIWSWIESRNGATLLKCSFICMTLVIALVGCSGGGGGGGVVGGNTAPSITAGCSSTNQSDLLMGTLVASDADPISFSLDVNAPMVAGPVATANGGMVELTDVTTGAFTYTPPAQGVGPRGRDSFQFRVDDPTSFSIATEMVIVNPKIMPLGDSITFGTGGTGVPPAGEEVAYRLQLLNRLTDASQVGGAYSFEYVGEESSGANLLPAGQTSHAGYGGCRDQDIAGLDNCFGLAPNLTGIYDELEQNPADIVLLHIGTNPQVLDPDPTDLETILNEIGRWEDSANGNPVSLVVMQIIPKMPVEPLVDTYNTNVIARITDRLMNNPVGLPDQIIYGDNEANVDMYTAFGGATPNAALYEDGLHPNAAGFTIMGDMLYSVLTGANRPAILQQCP